MGRQLHYKPGDYYVTDDRTGFPQYASKCRKQWDNQIVAERVFDTRHPQMDVRGVRDDQSVPDPRPQPPPSFGGPVYAALAAPAAIGAINLSVADTTALTIGNRFGVVLDSGSSFVTKLLAITGTTLTLRDALPYPAASGNLVCDYGVPG